MLKKCNNESEFGKAGLRSESSLSTARKGFLGGMEGGLL